MTIEEKVEAKKALRKMIRGLKKQYSAEELLQKSLRAMDKLGQHPVFVNAERVMLYAALPDEVQTADFIARWRHEKQIILPTVVGDDIIPVALTDTTGFAIGDFNIPEPQNCPYKGGFDLIVVPGMAFDSEGNRLGRGRGYYDRFLEQQKDVYRIGLCFDFQLVNEVPAEATDIKMNEIITAE